MSLQKWLGCAVLPYTGTHRTTRNRVEKFLGNNPMVGATVACAVAVEEASK